MTAVLIIGIIGTILAMLNRTQAVVAVDQDRVTTSVDAGQSDDLWQAFEAAMRGDSPAGRPVERSHRDTSAPEEGDIRTGMPAGNTTVDAMEEGSIGFVDVDAIQSDDFGQVWLLVDADVYAEPTRSRVAISRQPEGYLLQQNAVYTGRYLGADAVPIVGRFDFR